MTRMRKLRSWNPSHTTFCVHKVLIPQCHKHCYSLLVLQSLSLSSGVLVTHLKLTLEIFAASNLESIGEHLVHFHYWSSSHLKQQ